MNSTTVARSGISGDSDLGKARDIDVLVVTPYAAAIAAGVVSADDRALVNGEALVAPDCSTVACCLIAGDGAAMNVGVAECAKIDRSSLPQRSCCLRRLIIQELGVGHRPGG